jgi:hypothetical protein
MMNDLPHREPVDLSHSPVLHSPVNRPPVGPEHRSSLKGMADPGSWPDFDRVPEPTSAADLPLTLMSLEVEVRFWYRGRDWALKDLESNAPYIFRQLMQDFASRLQSIADGVIELEFRRYAGGPR